MGNVTRDGVEAASATYRTATNMIGEKFGVDVIHTKRPSKDFERIITLLYERQKNENERITDKISSNMNFGGSVDKIWAEHNYSWDNMSGVLLHIDFTVHNLKNAYCSCNAYFNFFDGTPIADENNFCKSYDGQVSVGNGFEPGYEPTTVYYDYLLFMPYAELHSAQDRSDIMFKILLFNGNVCFSAAPLYPLYSRL